MIAVVIAVVGGGAAGAWAATRPAGPSYRVATAGPASVTDSLTESGTIQPVSQATVMFPTAGLVSSVAAKLGQHVSVGQQLARLNTTALDNQVSADQSSVATAQAKVATDQDSQTADSVQTTSPSSVGSGGHSGSSSAGVSADQNAVRKAQQQVDADLTLVAAAEHKVSAQGAACQSLLDQLKSPPPTTTSTTPTPTGTTTVSDCETLINAVLSDESRTGSDEHTLSSAVAALSTELDKAAAAVGQSAKSSNSRSSGGGSTSGGSGGGSTSGGGSGSGAGGRTAAPATADQIAADQAQVDAATAQLAAAQQNRAAATLVSPIAGTVADVTITEGQNATANSADAEIVVIGTGQDEVTTAVTDNQVGEIKAGEQATITPDGATKPISGQVTQVGALSTTTSSGAAGYPVTISLNSTDQQLFDGATATVSITLNTARATVTVPTSAIRTLGGFSLVTKMVDGQPRPTRVTVGVQGPVVTQVTSGLTAGDQVELADVTAPMPTSGNTTGAGIRIAGGGGGFTRRAGG